MHAFDLDRKVEADPEFLNELRQRHHHNIESFSFEFEKPFNVEKFEMFVQELSEKQKVYRSKGFIAIAGNPRRAIFHGVNNASRLCGTRGGRRRTRASQLVFIVKELTRRRSRRVGEVPCDACEVGE